MRTICKNLCYAVIFAWMIFPFKESAPLKYFIFTDIHAHLLTILVTQEHSAERTGHFSRSTSRAALDGGSVYKRYEGTEKILCTKNHSQALIWGQQLKAIQGMLDFDYVCERRTPSVAASTYPLAGDHKQKFYFGHKEVLVPGAV